MSVCGTWRSRRCDASVPDRTGAGGRIQRIPGQNASDQYTRCVCHRRAGGSGRKAFASAASGTDAKDRRLRWLYNIFHICTRDQPAVPERKLWTGDRVCVCQCYFEHCGGAVRVHVAVLRLGRCNAAEGARMKCVVSLSVISNIMRIRYLKVPDKHAAANSDR